MRYSVGKSPALARVFRSIYVSFPRGFVRREIEVIHSVLVSDRSSPLAASIHGALPEVVFRTVVERGEHITCHAPVYQVLGVHHRGTWH